MYKVFINYKEINFHNEKPSLDCSEGIAMDQSIFDDFDNQLAKFEKDDVAKTLHIYGDRPETLFVKFGSFFNIIKAAGGIVKSEKNELLFIYRNRRWDLPKGKSDPGESIEQTALREVKEECGIDVSITGDFVFNTYHIYITESGQNILKKTYWFEMSANSSKELTPQTEEGIEEVRWFAESDLFIALNSIYSSLQYLMENYFNSKV